MLPVIYTPALQAEYESLWDSAQVQPHWVAAARLVAGRAVTKQFRYEIVANRIQAPGRFPWQVLAALHAMESSQNFGKHIHNGDPLTAKTVHVPAGRPNLPHPPPYTWEESAQDALELEHANRVPFARIAQVLFWVEGWNGFGYRRNHPHVLTPYLWSGTQHYVAGKYAADGRFDPNLVSQQIGVVAILKTLPAIAFAP